MSQKSSSPKTFCNIFTHAKCITVKFCQFVYNLYLHVLANFGWFILIFSKIVYIFLWVVIVFTVSSLEFHQVKSPSSISNDEWPSIHPTSITGLSDLVTMLECYHKLQLKPKIVPEFKDTLQLIWFALPKKAIDTAVKCYRKWLQACVSPNGGYSEHTVCSKKVTPK